MKNYQIDSFIYHVSDSENAVYIQGWYFDPENKPTNWASFSNDQPVEDMVVKKFSRPDVRMLYPQIDIPSSCGFSIKVPVNHKNPSFRLEVNDQVLVKLNSRTMKRAAIKNPFLFDIQIRHVKENNYQIVGWAAALPGHPVKISLENSRREKLKTSVERNSVALPSLILNDEQPLGFAMNVDENIKKTNLWLVLEYEGSKKRIYINPDMSKIRKAWEGLRLMEDQRAAFISLKGLARYLNTAVMKRGFRYSETKNVKVWLKENALTESEIHRQRHSSFEKEPLISVLVPAYKPDLLFFDKMVQSVLDQTYSNWELIISDGSDDDVLKEHMEKYANNNRIHYIHRKEEANRGISANTNAAADLAKGEYFAFMDHDDMISPDALFEMAKAINDGDYKLLYSDEDKVCWVSNPLDPAGGAEVYEDLAFKPDFSIDYLRTCNYINHLSVVHRSVFEELQGLRSEFDGAQDFDLWLRAVETTDWSKIHHIPRVLYHWRKHPGSTAEVPDSKGWAFQAGERALKAHLQRQNLPAVIEETEFAGSWQVNYLLEQEPLVSIIIPNKDHITDLKRLLEGLEHRNTYQNYEVLIVENNSEDQKTFDFYKEAEKKYRNVKVLYWDGIFNYSAINNFAARQAKGELLLLLNNDTDVIDKDFIYQMAGNAIRPEVGAVGIKLLYENDTIQHAGVILGKNGPYHAFLNEKPDIPEYSAWKCVQHNVAAVTGACLMVEAKKYWQVGGLDELFQVAYNDIDFCLKLLRAGYYNVILERTKMYHLESVSRGSDMVPEKIKRFRREQWNILNRYRDLFEKGDPYYNVNLSQMHSTGMVCINEEKEELGRLWKESIDDSDVEH